jgi:hypothetical protein
MGEVYRARDTRLDRTVAINETGNPVQRRNHIQVWGPNCVLRNIGMRDEHCAIRWEFRLCSGNNLADRDDVHCKSSKRQQGAFSL